MKPSAVAVVVPNAGVNAANSDVSATVFVPPAYPVRVVVIVAVELVPAATLVTVTKPGPLIATEPDAVAVPAHVSLESKLLIWTVKPSAVAVGVPNTGVNAAASEVAVTVAEPPTVFDLVVVIVAVELVPAATLVTVTKPVLSMATVPDAVAVPAHV